MRKRIDEMEIMRGLAIIAIVLLHVTAYFMGSPGSHLAYKVSFFFNQVTRFALPLFMVMSGWALAYNAKPEEDIDYAVFIKKRVKNILTPYLVWSVVYFIFYLTYIHKVPLGGGKLEDVALFAQQPWQLIPIFLKNLLFGWNYVHLYFIILIFQFYLIFPLIIGPIRRVKSPLRFLTVASVLYILLMIYLFYFRVLTGNLALDIFVRYYAGMLISWYVYFLIGILIGMHFQAFNDFANKHSLKMIALYVLTTVLVLVEAWSTSPGDIPKLTSLRVTVFLNTLVSIFFYFRVSQLLKGRKLGYKLVQITGRHSFTIYFVHLMLLVLLNNQLLRLSDQFSLQRTLYLPVLFIVTWFASLLFAHLEQLAKGLLRKQNSLGR